MVNVLVAITNTLWGSFGLAIVVLTVLVRLATLPLTMRQLRSTKAMQSLGPKLKELQKTYAKDKQKLQQETMKLYREAGINPLGCLVPMIVQLPVWIALYQSIIKSLGYTPEDLLGLSRLLYPWPVVHQAIPLNDKLLWLNLSVPDTLYVLPVLVGVSMWLQQKMTTQTAADADARQQQMNTMMLWMMPVMFAFFTLQFPSGLALYWIAYNIIGIVIQYFATGWGGLATVPGFRQLAGRQQPPAREGVVTGTARQVSTQKRAGYGKQLPGDKRKDRR
ncbi:MAG: membrane protein insertase YidC [Chloroflexi bacterium]|nr:membrane protein insertase YidC [Chloroflexota bacterium]